jgi:hypothetical protein
VEPVVKLAWLLGSNLLSNFLSKKIGGNLWKIYHFLHLI